MLEDSKIIDLFYVRAEQAVAELLEKYGTSCGRIAKNILKNDLDAEECVNDACLAAWNTIPPQRPDPLRTYLFRIVRNIAIARYHANTAEKRNSHYDAALEELERCLAAPGSVEDAVSAGELSRAINSFLASLDKESRVLFVLRYWYSYSVAELAERFQTSGNNVSVRLFRIRNRLKKHLKKEGIWI